MKRLAAVLVVVMVLASAARATSGQQTASGRLVNATGGGLAGCEVIRDARLGFGFGGGFDDRGHVTGDDGEFSLPLARGLNTLLFRCPGVDVRKRVLVVRGNQHDYTLTAGGG